MGALFYNGNEVRKLINSKFQDDKNFLVVSKHNNTKKSIIKLLLSNLYYTIDNNRTFVLYFSPDGVYSTEISNSIKENFDFIDWKSIQSFELIDNLNKPLIKILSNGKMNEYEVPFVGKIFDTNKDNINELKMNNWYRD